MDSVAAKGQPNIYPPTPGPGDTNDDGSFTTQFEQKVAEFLNSRVIYTHPNRVRRYEMHRLSDYYRMSQQWKRKLRTGRSNLTRYRDLYFDPNDPRSIPTPVLNIIEDKIRNEAARLSQPDYRPYVPVSGINPDVTTREGARLAVQALEHCLRENSWASLQLTLGTNHMAQYGGWWLKSWWDLSFEETTTVGAPDAVHCPSCGFSLASPALSAPQAARLGGVAAGLERTGPDSYMAGSCPTCMDPSGVGRPLQPFTPVGQELFSLDSLGRPLGQPVPLGQWRCETRSDYDMWVEHDGIEVLPGQWEEVCEVRPVNIEWLRNRYAAAFDVEPETEAALRKWHPIALDYGFGYMSPHTPNRRARLWEFYKRPWRIREKDPVSGEWTTRMNRGCMIHFSNGKLLRYGDLLETGPTGETFPSVLYTYIPFEARSGGKELHGVGLFEGLVRAQDSTNRVMSMVEDYLYRLGVPSFLVTKAMSFAWEASGRAGRRVVFEPDDRYPQMTPKEIGGQAVNPSLFELADRYAGYSEKLAASRETEQGGVETGVTAAAAIQLNLENAGAQRAQRLLRIREGLKEQWSHGLTMLSNKVREPRKLWNKDNPGRWQERVWQGSDLQGQTRVEIDANPVYDSDIVQMINLKSAAEMGTIDPTNPKTAMLINRRLHIPNELLEAESLQSDLAEREFKDFFERGVEPWIDSELDHDASHADRHGLDMESEPWIDLEEQAGTKQAWAFLEDWDKPRPFEPPMPGQPPSMLPPPWIALMKPPEMPPMPGAPPAPPMPPSPVPLMDEQLRKGNPMTGNAPIPALESRILAYWQMLLQAGGIQLQPGSALWVSLRFRAHRAAHRKRAEESAAQAPTQPIMAPPDAPKNVAGMTPGIGPGAPPVPDSVR